MDLTSGGGLDIPDPKWYAFTHQSYKYTAKVFVQGHINQCGFASVRTYRQSRPLPEHGAPHSL